MNFWPCDRFLEPLAQRRNKKCCVCGPAFGASLFFNFGASRPWTLGALDSLGPRAVWIPRWNREQKNSLGLRILGPSIFKFWGPITFSGDLGLFGAPRWNTKTGNKKKTFGVDFLGPRVFWGTWALWAPLWRTVWGPRWNRKQKIQKKK
jgi:hypothetical protein